MLYKKTQQTCERNKLNDFMSIVISVPSLSANLACVH